MDRLADLLIRHYRWCMGGLLAVTGGALAFLGWSGIQFDANIENFFPEGDPIIEQYADFVETYERDDGLLLIGFEHPELFSFPVLRDIEAITDSLDTLPGVERVVSLTNFERLQSGTGGIETRRLIERFSSDPDVLAAQRTAVLSDSTAVGYVINAEANVTAFLVNITSAERGYAARQVVIDGIRQIAARYADRYTFRYSGIPFLRNTYVDSLRVETVKYFFLASLLIVGVLAWVFRTVRGVVMPLLVVYIGVLWTITLMMLVGRPIDILTSTLTAILLVVGVADSIHLLAKYYDALTERYDKIYAVREMVVRLGAATFLTSLTTAIGFATLVTSSVVPMQRFGLFTALGVLLTFVVSVIFLSSILLRTRLPTPIRSRHLTRGWLPRFLDWVDRVTHQYPGRIVGFALILVGLCILAATQLRVNAYVNDDLGPDTQAYQDMVFFQNRLVAPFPLEVLIRAPEPGAFKEPERLRQAAAVAAYLGNQPAVKRTVSLVEVLERVNQVMHGDSTAYHRLPETRQMTSEYLFLLELTDPEALERLVDFDYQELRISALMDDIGSYEMKRFTARLDSMLAGTLDPDLQVTKTGTTILAAGIGDYLTESLLFSIGLAFVFISILMGLLFRNLKLVLISLIPNVVPLIVTAGVMGMLSIDIKPATAVIFTISFGIAVDDTIHALARLRQELSRGFELRQAIQRTLLGTGKAIILTSLILLGGFSILVTSDFQSSAYMGGLISVTILTALMADLFLLPALLYLWKPDVSRVRRSSTAESQQRDVAA